VERISVGAVPARGVFLPVYARRRFYVLSGNAALVRARLCSWQSPERTRPGTDRAAARKGTAEISPLIAFAPASALPRHTRATLRFSTPFSLPLVCQSSRSYDARLVIRFTAPVAIALPGKSSSNKIQYPAGGASSSRVASPGRARDSRIRVCLIGGILNVAADILSQSRRAVCSRCGSMNSSMEGKSRA